MMLLVALLLLCDAVLSFLYSPFVYSRVGSRSLEMGGGRNKEEVGLTKKQLFQTLKKKLNTAAEAPGFFDIEADKVVSFQIKCVDCM